MGEPSRHLARGGGFGQAERYGERAYHSGTSIRSDWGDFAYIDDHDDLLESDAAMSGIDFADHRPYTPGGPSSEGCCAISLFRAR